MEAKERIYNGMLMNGFLALLVNLVVLPVLAFLTMYYMMDVTWFSIPVMIILSLVFFIMFAGYFSQEPNEARVMVFFGKYIQGNRILLGESFYGKEEALHACP